MRTERVFSHYRCNQACTYCTFRRAEDVLHHIGADAVRARIDAAVDAGASEIVVTGGEPGMRSDLTLLVAYAKRRATRVVLETNGTLIDAPRARALADAGLDAVLVNLAGTSAERVDAITRDPGGFARTLTGIRAFADAGIPVFVQASLVASTRAMLPTLPAMLARTFGEAVAGLVVNLPGASPEDEELLEPLDAARTLTEIAEAARREGLSIKLAPDAAPPPCTFEELGRVAHLFTLTPGTRPREDRARIDACASCVLADRCDGFDPRQLARFGAPRVRPVTEDRLRRRLSLIGTVQEQVQREFVQHNRHRDVGGADFEEDLIRINFHCNQSCRFCFVSTHLPAPADADVRAAILEAARRGRRIALTGGEPTLNAALPEYVRLAKASSTLPVLLQTNAIRLASAALTETLVAAGLGEAFVSLHGATAEIADAVTSAPGTFEKSCLGLDNLVAAGVNVIVNFVICEANVADLENLVTLVARRWPSVFLNVSFVAASTDMVPRERALVPRYTDAMPALERALVRARALGVRIGGFESMCGIPLCLVPDDMSALMALSEVPEGYDGGEFVKTAACASCALASRCFGLRRGYAELHGADELTPFPRSSPLARDLPPG